jgi:hypothetical protein
MFLQPQIPNILIKGMTSSKLLALMKSPTHDGLTTMLPTNDGDRLRHQHLQPKSRAR